MQMNDLILLMVKVLLSVCVALVMAYAVPYIKTLKEDARYARIVEIIEVAVRAAEQTIKEHGQGRQRKAEVIRFVSAWLARNGIEITEAELDQLIEAAVYAMTQE